MLPAALFIPLRAISLARAVSKPARRLCPTAQADHDDGGSQRATSSLGETDQRSLLVQQYQNNGRTVKRYFYPGARQFFAGRQARLRFQG